MTHYKSPTYSVPAYLYRQREPLHVSVADSMGAQQSSNQQKPSEQGDAGGPHVKTCYYELLSVDRQASDDEYVD